MPTTATASWSGQKLEPYQDPDLARDMDVQFVASLGLLPRGTVLGQVTATGLWKAYASGNVDGSEVPRMILAYDINVIAASKVVYTTTSGQSAGELGDVYNAAPAYYRGTFRTNDLTGLDANAVTKLAGRLVSGSVTDGILAF